MLAHLPKNEVRNVAMAVVLEEASAEAKSWKVYLLNLKNEAIETVMISSKGYGMKKGKEVKTSVLRHAFPRIEAHEYALVEMIDEQVFGLNNEYWLSYYQNGTIYDKKFIFLPESIVEENLVRVPLLNKPGVIIG
ncbi:hypothetical protein EDD80_10336 [Anseongella ginsenosidimutans]|uniref:Uncharacterized protein n=1 Tax=Anseongella ginsenosidimutans TaxID=496056 RepID=A0A4R3KU50_9SPHI|nr:hypothetical protein [Anseongella ginsenosidimutans]QEC53301.1 hypothetical protein FRZ59_13775 [Anseongella ginsenosidimutans]TCS88175.1 hypothetical protein EDD80_10336 [Anseongella ginsenosidimutans]